ncbi:MAG TPA: hypothetical protein VF787_08300 [Thermoanaerobaculia bacterium]
MTAFLLSLAIFPLVGLATALLARFPLPPTRASRAAFLYLLGLGVEGAFLYALGALRVPLNAIAFAALPVIALPVIFVRRNRATLVASRCEQLQILASIVFAVPLVVMLFATAIIPTRDYDGRVTWLPKARAVALEASIAGPFFHGERGLNLHNHYPLLLPLDVGAVMNLSGDTRNEAGRWIYLFAAIAGLVVMRGFLHAWFASTGAWIAAAVAWLPLLTTIEGGALAAYNDFTLAALLGVAVLYLIEGHALVAGLFAAFMILTKNEGTALALAVLVAAIVARRFRWPMLIPVAIAEVIVVTARKLVLPAYDERYEVLFATLPRSLSRVPEAMTAIVRHAGEFREWGPFWIVVALAIVAGLFVARNRQFAIPLVAMVLAIGAYVAALTVTSWSIADLAPVAVNRLLAQLLVPGATVIATVVHALHRSR